MRLIILMLALMPMVLFAQSQIKPIVLCPKHVSKVTHYSDGNEWPALRIALSIEGRSHFSQMTASLEDAMVKFVDESGAGVTGLTTRLFGPIESEIFISGLLSEQASEDLESYLMGRSCLFGRQSEPNKKMHGDKRVI